MDTKYKQDFIAAGKIAKEVRAYGKSLIIKGASYNDVIQKIRGKIEALGAIPAFPPQIALDNVAAHFLPLPGQDIIFTNELVKLDIGVCYQGAIGDCAVSVDLSGKHKHIVDAAEAALKAAKEFIKVGITVGEIGEVIEKTILSFGLQPIRNLTGHGLGKFKVHTAPHIPNYKDGSRHKIKPGMTFAIEPFATDGKGLVHDGKGATLFSVRDSKRKYDGFIKEVYNTALSFHGLPFCMHDLITATAPIEIVKKAAQVLTRDGAFDDYAPLIEVGGGMVAQAEDSILIDEKGRVFFTTC